ncbi:TM0106 family RecB-like putative nuclease [Sphingomonas metalli]|nr:TM0106 family RecB-like putative nuclease [Sphingomonas metalli]
MLRDLLLCERKVALDAHGGDARRDPVSPFVRMLWRDGLAHEDAILGRLRGSVVDLRGDDRDLRERETSRAMAAGAPTILGAVIRSGDKIGMPDLLTASGAGHVAFDVKSGAALESATGRYKREYLVQVAHYARILGEIGAGPADTCGIVDRTGAAVTYDLSIPLGRNLGTGGDLHASLLTRAREVLDGAGDTAPALSARCGMCEWRSHCRAELAATDDLTLIPGLGRAIRAPISSIADTVAGLAAADPAQLRALPGVGVDRLRRFAERARLLADPSAGPVARAPLKIPAAEHEVDFDVEADPMRGIVYLHGFWHERESAEPGFVYFFAETPDERGERRAFAQAIGHFRQHRDAQWFHYSAYERTAYRDLQRRHPEVCDAAEIEAIFASERCTDLYATVAAQTDWPLSSYGIKAIAKACGFAWEDKDPGGAASIEWYDRHVAGEAGLRERIVAYNRDDVRAGARVRAALRELEATGHIAGFQRPAA